MAAVVAFDGQCEDLEVPLDVVDMEESAAAEAEAMMEAQAQAAALIDTLQGDMHTCGRCQEIVLEVNMAPATSGEFRNSWLCRNEEACIARAMVGLARGYGGSAKSLNDTGADRAGKLGSRCEV